MSMNRLRRWLHPAAAVLMLSWVYALPGAEPPQPDAPHLGRPATAADIAAWNLSVFPDGTGLPPGHGTAVEGEKIYNTRCVSCHGPHGEGASAQDLVGRSHPLDSEEPDQNVGSYWPYATTIFDFIRRAMPMNAPESLSADEIYAVTAYLLYENGIIGQHEEMNSKTLPEVRMPNRNGFIWIDAKHQPPPVP